MNFRIILSILLIILLSSVNLGQDELPDEPKPSTSGTIAKVYVEFPNFKVLDDASTIVFTVIFNAAVPEFYEGTLIQLESVVLDYLIRVVNNLNVKKVIFFEEDIGIGEELRKRVDLDITII